MERNGFVEMCVCFTLLGVLATASITLFCLISRTVWREKSPAVYYDDGTPARFYVTGDKHRNFEKVKAFCRDMQLRRKDVLIILGDCGFNFYEDQRDDQLKAQVAELNVTLFCLHGNKEKRPESVGTYGVRDFYGGKVYYEPSYPNLYFAIDGEVYTFEGREYMAIGGAHSVDKLRCLEEGTPFFEDEMPNEATKIRVEETLEKKGYAIDGMLTHTCPLKYLPTEMFMSTRQKADNRRRPRRAKLEKVFKPDVDRSTEEWLDRLEEKLEYTVWLCGHYHIDKQIDKVSMLFCDIRPLHYHWSEAEHE